MMTILEALAAALIKWLASWLEGRQATKAAAASIQAQAAATRGAEAAQTKVEQVRQANEAQVDTVRSVGPDNDGLDGSLRKQSAEIQSAANKADGELQ